MLINLIIALLTAMIYNFEPEMTGVAIQKFDFYDK